MGSSKPTTEELWVLFFKYEAKVATYSDTPERQLAAATMAAAITRILVGREILE